MAASARRRRPILQRESAVVRHPVTILPTGIGPVLRTYQSPVSIVLRASYRAFGSGAHFPKKLGDALNYGVWEKDLVLVTKSRRSISTFPLLIFMDQKLKN
jgi:hypothetical protein